MRGWLCAMLVIGMPARVYCDETSPSAAAVDAAIERGLAFLTEDALAWKAEHDCASCHHASLVVWSMHEARSAGYEVDEAVRLELMQWMANSGDGRSSIPRPEAAPRALHTKALYFALGLSSDPQAGPEIQPGLQTLLATLQSDQLEDGSWSAWPDTRPPLFGGSNDSMTGLAALALLPSAASGDAAAIAARDKALAWLEQTPTDDELQSVALRLALWQRMGRPDEEGQELAQRIRERQNDDGGWSQAPSLASDAWATGQALYALDHVASEADQPAMARAQAFLVATQLENGSWPMASRPAKPDSPGANNLVPIIGAGSAWGVIGLARSK